MKEGWEYKKLDDICYSVQDGDWIESKDQSPNGIRLIQTGNIGNGVYKDKQDSAKYISEETFKRLNCTEIFEGDILVSRLPDPVGRACILPDLGCRCITAVDCSILRLKKDIVCNAWISYYMQSLAYFSLIKAQCTGSTRLRITRKKLAEILIPIPPLSEQQSIVDYLDSAFAKIDAMKANAEKALNEAKALFQASLKEMLEPQKGWEEKKLGEVGTFIRGGNFSKKDFVEGGFPCIHYGQIHTKLGVATYKHLSCVPASMVKKDRCASRGDLVIAVTSEDDEGSCKCTAWMADYDAYVGGHAAILKHSLNPIFVSYYFKAARFQKAKLEYTHGFKVVEISPKDIAKIPIAYPSPSEQQSIVDTLDSLKSKVDRLQENYDKISQECDALKQAILRQVFE